MCWWKCNYSGKDYQRKQLKRRKYASTLVDVLFPCIGKIVFQKHSVTPECFYRESRMLDACPTLSRSRFYLLIETD
jgi:hypothetical protein